MLAGKDPKILFDSLKRDNPQFRDFVNHAQDKTLEELAMEYDLDLELLKHLM